MVEDRDYSSRQYSSEEVSRIVRRALNHQDASDSISHQELLETAAEMGVGKEALEAAIELETTEYDMECARKEWLKRQRTEFKGHFWTFLIVVGAMLLLNLFTRGGWWVQWVFWGWGIGIAFHFYGAFFPDEAKIEEGAKKVLEQKRERK